jgi:2-oxo-3-(phosphooxy)propyl 3-oxoalkanoate synthase
LQLVRRYREQDVFVTNLRVLGDDTFEVSARWPAEHCFYGPSHGYHDPLLLLETVREATLLVSHVVYQVPREHKFITREKRFDMAPAGMRTVSGEHGDEPVDVVITMKMHDIKRRGRTVAGMRTEASCTRDGVRIGGANYQWSCVSSAVYNRVRGRYMTVDPAVVTDFEPVPAHRVDRTDDVNVMLAGDADGDSWDLRVDTAHPVIYDHRVDHVPGYGCIEAARQAALLAVGRPDAMVVAGDFAFFHFLEFDARCVVSAQQIGEADGVSTVKVTFEQNDELAIEGVFDLARRG